VRAGILKKIPMSSETKKPLYTLEFFRVTAVFFLLMSTMTMLFLLPIFVEEKGGNAFDIGLVMGAMPVAAVLSRIFLGRWMDTAGRKKVLLFCGLANTGLMFLFLTVDSIGSWLIFLRFIQGIAMGGYIAAVWTIMADRSPPSRLAEGLGIFGIAGMAALAVGPRAGEYILDWGYGFKGIFIVSGIISAAGVGMTFFIGESRPSGTCETFIHSFRKMFRGDLVIVLLITVAFSVSRAAFASFFAEYSRLEAIGSMGIFSMIYSGTTVSLRLIAGRVADRAGRELVLLPGLAVFGLGIGLIAFIQSYPVFILSAVLCGAGHCFLYPVLNALVIEKVHSCSRGTATGIFTSSFDIGLGAGSLIWGTVADLGSYHLMYILAGLTAIIGIGGAGKLFREKKGRRAKLTETGVSVSTD